MSRKQGRYWRKSFRRFRASDPGRGNEEIRRLIRAQRALATLAKRAYPRSSWTSRFAGCEPIFSATTLTPSAPMRAACTDSANGVYGCRRAPIATSSHHVVAAEHEGYRVVKESSCSLSDVSSKTRMVVERHFSVIFTIARFGRRRSLPSHSDQVSPELRERGCWGGAQNLSD